MNGAAIETTKAERGLIIVSIMLATLMQLIDMTIANVALPHIQGALSATPDQVAWVLTSYIVASAIIIPLTGVLADRFGRKEVILISVVGFTASSVLCGMAMSLHQLVAFRTLQGAFGAALVPLSQAVMMDIYPRERYARAMSLWGLGVMMGPIIGPTLGGYLTETLSWRWVFYINLPVGILATMGIVAFVPGTVRDLSRRFDLIGFVLLSAAIGAFQLMLDRGSSEDWFASTEIIIEAMIAGLCFYMFIVHMFTVDKPYVQPGLFKDRNFVLGLCFVGATGFVMLTTGALIPLMLQNLMGVPVLTVGLVLAPRGAGTMLCMLIAGRLADRMDGRWLIFAGLVLTAYSLWEMSEFTLDVSMMRITEITFIQGVGVGLIFVPMSSIAFASLAARYRNEGTAMFNLSRSLGSSVGVSIMTTLIARETQRGHTRLSEFITPFRDVVRPEQLPELWDWSTPAGAAALNWMVSREAAFLAFLNDYKLMVVLTVLCLPLVFLLHSPKAVAAKQAAAEA